MEKIYTCEEVAKRYGVKVSTVWEWIRRKKLPALCIGKHYRVRESDLTAFEIACKTTNADNEDTCHA